MKSGSVRAGSLLVGVAGALALPAAALAQLEPIGDAVGGVGQQIEQAVPQVTAPAPVKGLTAPSKPADAAPSQPSSAGSPAPAAGPPSGGGATAAAGSSSPGSPTGRSASARGAGRSTHKARAGKAAKAHAASSGKQADRALGQAESDGAATPDNAGSFTAGAQPETGVIGDSRLPFTGGYLLLILALGLGAVLTGLMLRTASRSRLARRHGH